MIRPLAVLALVAACGDNQAPSPDATAIDSIVEPRAIVVSGSFAPGSTGVMSALLVDSLTMKQQIAPNNAVGSDPMLRKVGDELFIVNRNDGNNVTIVDALTFKVIEQLGTGPGSNPQDVAVVGTKLFVPLYEKAGVLVLTRGNASRAMIDLSALDPDGAPNCNSVYAVGDEVYVACERLDANFQPRGPGIIAVIDAATHAVKTTFEMANVNPYGVFERLPGDGDLVIPTVDFANVTAGCVERIKVGPAPAANGCMATNAVLGGFVLSIDFQDSIALLAVSNGQFGPDARQRLRGYDLDARMLWAAPMTPDAQLIVDLAVCPSGLIVVADQTTASNGLRVYDGYAEKTATSQWIGLRPGAARGLVCY